MYGHYPLMNEEETHWYVPPPAEDMLSFYFMQFAPQLCSWLPFPIQDILCTVYVKSTLLLSLMGPTTHKSAFDCSNLP